MDGNNEILEHYIKGITNPGDIISITSHAKAGKTALLLELANNRCGKGEVVVWFDTSNSLHKPHLCERAIVVKGINSLNDIVKVSTVLHPGLIIVDDISKIKQLDLSKNANYLKRMCYRTDAKAFLVHQIRRKPTGNTYFHNLPVRLDDHVSVKIYLERYKQIDPMTNLVMLLSRRKNEHKRKILVTIGTDGKISEHQLLTQMCDRFKLIPPTYLITPQKKHTYILDNTVQLHAKVIEQIDMLHIQDYVVEGGPLKWLTQK